MTAVAVMGAGSWGTTVAKVFADAGNQVRLWARREEAAIEIQRTRENARYIPGVLLPANIDITHDEYEAIKDAEIVVLGVPSQTLRTNLDRWKKHLSPKAVLVSLAKGLERSTDMRMSEVIHQVTGWAYDQIAVLTGPNLAKEIAAGQPAATVIASENEEAAKFVQYAVATPYFRPYTNTDLIGCEIGGVSKNVIALAAGMASGRGLGHNTAATIITRGLAESTRLGIALGAKPLTFSGLAGLGDLVATCSSPLSRNRTFGEHLGSGMTLDKAKEASNGQVAEGVVSCQSMQALARKYGVEVPIADAVVHVCHEDGSVSDVISQLMQRSKKSE